MKLLSVAEKEQLEASRQELQVNHPDYVDGDDYCDVAEMLRLLDHKDARIAQLESEPGSKVVKPECCITARCRQTGAHIDCCPNFIHTPDCDCKYCKFERKS